MILTQSNDSNASQLKTPGAWWVTDLLNSIDSDLEQIRQIFHMPGMAVAVLQEGHLIFDQGYGYRDRATQDPFTPQTLCLVASTTKSFTATLTGILVDEGILEWTVPVRSYWSQFKMMDDYATHEISLTDMMCHRSGLPYHENLLAYGVGRELPDRGREYRRELLDRLAYFDPAHPFRTQFQYQDIVFTCAGGILERVMDQHYEDLIADRLLVPLELNDSTCSRQAARETGRLAQGYGWVNGSIQPIPFCDTRYIAPCAGLYTTSSDLIRWIQFQLDRGGVGSRQLISETSLSWIHRPHMTAMPLSAAVGGGLATYGLGWVQSLIHGHLLLSHGGSFNGYRTFMGMVPDLQIGVVVLCNLNVTHGMLAAGFAILDRLMGVDRLHARIDHFQALAQRFTDAEIQDQQEFLAGQDRSRPPQHSLDRYTGLFHHPGYGTFILELRDGSLWQTYEGRSFPVEPYCGETFATRYQSTENRLIRLILSFVSDAQAEVVAVKIPIVPGIEPPCFSRSFAQSTEP